MGSAASTAIRMSTVPAAADVATSVTSIVVADAGALVVDAGALPADRTCVLAVGGADALVTLTGGVGSAAVRT